MWASRVELTSHEPTFLTGPTTHVQDNTQTYRRPPDHVPAQPTRHLGVHRQPPNRAQEARRMILLELLVAERQADMLRQAAADRFAAEAEKSAPSPRSPLASALRGLAVWWREKAVPVLPEPRRSPMAEASPQVRRLASIHRQEVPRTMPRYIVIHHTPGVNMDDFRTNIPEVLASKHATFIKTFTNLTNGTIVNIYEGASVAAVERELERVGFPFDEVQELQFEATADDLSKFLAAA
jgi:hypothetical protein